MHSCYNHCFTNHSCVDELTLTLPVANSLEARVLVSGNLEPFQMKQNRYSNESHCDLRFFDPPPMLKIWKRPMHDPDKADWGVEHKGDSMVQRSVTDRLHEGSWARVLAQHQDGNFSQASVFGTRQS